jgi:hypothetical protein
MVAAYGKGLQVTRIQRLEVIHERNTKRMSFYSAPLGSILGSGIYLNTDLLRQQFDGASPSSLTIEIKGDNSGR